MAKNKLQGTPAKDILHGDASDNFLQGKAGDDELWGYEGDDRLDGGKDNDEIHGGEGDDILLGRQGGDELFGGDNDDFLNSGNCTNSSGHRRDRVPCQHSGGGVSERQFRAGGSVGGGGAGAGEVGPRKSRDVQLVDRDVYHERQVRGSDPGGEKDLAPAGRGVARG